MEILSNQTGKKVILLGNEAIVRGALEAGVDFVSTYPGTPATEVGDTFAKIAEKSGVYFRAKRENKVPASEVRQGPYFEYSTNEKVAMEAAAGAAFSGLKSLVAMKNFGLNVASDSLLPLAYTGIAGAMVVVVADDPNCWSSAQTEQDTRYYAQMAHLPMLEPTCPQECKDFIKEAFRVSEKFKIPVILRTTTRVSHQSAPVKLEEIISLKKDGVFEAGKMKFSTLPPRVILQKKALLEKIRKIKEISEQSQTQIILTGKGKLGAITSGAGFNYLMDGLKEFNLKIPILKLGFTYPLPEIKIKKFIKNLKTLFVVEELEPYLEEEIKGFAREVNPKLKIIGDELFPKAGELKTEHIIFALSKILKKKSKFNFAKHQTELKKIDSPPRFPMLCPGCPYWQVFLALKKTCPPGTVIGGDIGCYMIAGFPPHQNQDYLISMGAGIGVGHGIVKASQQKVVALIGDSTFFHAGIPALINAVFNKSSLVVIILENGTTAMTGHQPNPGTSLRTDSYYEFHWKESAVNSPNQEMPLDIEAMVRACGVKNLKIVDSFKYEEIKNALSELLAKKEASVIISRGICALLAKKLKK